jgi:tRNA (cytidine/uridine-2'-O-)-methyltransferase
MIHAVLYEPEIPQNTGNIMRTCAAFGVSLHLIEPLGFYLDEAHLKRAGLDYRELVSWKLWPDWETFEKENPGTHYFLTRYGTKPPDACDFTAEEELYFIFGKESTGIPKEILRKHRDQCIRIPMKSEARCLNLSNTAAIVLYEAHRQRGYDSLSFEDEFKPGILES